MTSIVRCPTCQWFMDGDNPQTHDCQGRPSWQPDPFAMPLVIMYGPAPGPQPGEPPRAVYVPPAEPAVDIDLRLRAAWVGWALGRKLDWVDLLQADATTLLEQFLAEEMGYAPKQWRFVDAMLGKVEVDPEAVGSDLDTAIVAGRIG